MKALQSGEPFFGWRMVSLAFIAYNFGITVVVNSFAPALLVMQQEQGASRAGVASALNLCLTREQHYRRRASGQLTDQT